MSHIILIHQDFPPKISSVRSLLEDLHAEIVITVDGRDVVEKARQFKPLIALIDWNMPQMAGLQCCQHLKSEMESLKVILAASDQGKDIVQHLPATRCDFFCFHSEMDRKIGQYLVTLFSKQGETENIQYLTKTKYPQLRSHGFVFFQVGDKTYQGDIESFNQHELKFYSFQAPNPGSSLHVQLCSPVGEEFECDSHLMQITWLKNSMGMASFLVSIQIPSLGENQENILHSWMVYDHTVKCPPASVTPVKQETQPISVQKEKNENPDSTKSLGRVQCYFQEIVYEGLVINLSSNGILFAASEDFESNSPVKVVLFPPGLAPFSVEAVVVRTIELKEPREGFCYAVGARFSNIDSAKIIMIERWVASTTTGESLVPVPEPEFVRQIVQANYNQLTDLIVHPTKDPRLRFIGELSDFEKDAFVTDTPQSLCVRRLVVLRVQCGVFYDFVPALQTDPKTYGEPFLTLLSPLLEAADAIEKETEEFVRVAVRQGIEENRQGLNTTSNRLHEVKTDILFRLTDNVPVQGLGKGTPVLEKIRERVAQIREFSKVSSETVKYSRRPKPLPPAKKQKKKGTALYKKTSFQVSFTASLLIVVGGGIWKFLSSRVSPKELDLPLTIDKIVKDETGVMLYCDYNSWKILKKEEQDLVFQKIEIYLRAQRLRQMKIVDKNEKPIAALASGKSGTITHFSKRIFR